MSISTDTDDMSSDYSDFEYQHVSYEHKERGDSSARSVMSNQFDILQDSGGLDGNEIAELVGMVTQVTVQPDDFQNNDEVSEGSLDFRGVLGANLNDISDPLRGNQSGGPVTSDANFIGGDGDGIVLDENDGADPLTFMYGHDKDEVFYSFKAGCIAPFENSTAGSGGGGGATSFIREYVPFRERFGRGPVLDAGDQIGIVSTNVKNQVSSDSEGHVRVHMVWDTATVDDAGRRFGL